MPGVDNSGCLYLLEHVASLVEAAKAAEIMASNLDEYYFGLDSPVKPDVDPPPQLHYEKIYACVRRCAPYLDRGRQNKFFKAYEYAAEARANYLIIHEKYHHVYHGLQDARAFHSIMLEQKAKAEKILETLEGKEGMELSARKKRAELENIDLQIQKNAEEVPDLLSRTQELGSRRDAISAEFVALKKQLNKEKLPELLYLARQICQRKGERPPVKEAHSTSCLSGWFLLLIRPLVLPSMPMSANSSSTMRAREFCGQAKTENGYQFIFG